MHAGKAGTVKRVAGCLPLALLLSCAGRSIPAEANDSKGSGQPPSSTIQESKPKPMRPPEVVVPEGTVFRVRLNQAVDTARNRPGDAFTTVLIEPVSAAGRTIIPAGVQLRGRIRESAPSGRFKGQARLALTLDSFELDGQGYRIVTDSQRRYGAAHKKRNWLLVGGGSGLGALIGGAAGGGRGALIGAGAGAGAGTVGAAITGKRHVRVPAESLLSFRLQQSIRLRAPAMENAS